eukprot:TRINITY_DN1558_c0_g1_i13.p1 TRINITY_DN1558_c0_g1~~TRINITY_DN1558_c0_g1_i13.p1  ORF type:complete len:188 (-),score=-2.77 TRINITY_DN1558_c0_g1_i13:392-955(-)
MLIFHSNFQSRVFELFIVGSCLMFKREGKKQYTRYIEDMKDNMNSRPLTTIITIILETYIFFCFECTSFVIDYWKEINKRRYYYVISFVVTTSLLTIYLAPLIVHSEMKPVRSTIIALISLCLFILTVWFQYILDIIKNYCKLKQEFIKRCMEEEKQALKEIIIAGILVEWNVSPNFSGNFLNQFDV